MGLFSARVQFEFVALFPCQFLTFPLCLLAVVCRYFSDFLGLVSVPSVVLLVVQGLVLDPLYVLLLLKILCRRYCHCRYLSQIALVPLDLVDRYHYCFPRCLSIGLGYLPIPQSLQGKVVQRWIEDLDSVRQCWNVYLGDDF